MTVIQIRRMASVDEIKSGLEDNPAFKIEMAESGSLIVSKSLINAIEHPFKLPFLFEKYLYPSLFRAKIDISSIGDTPPSIAIVNVTPTITMYVISVVFLIMFFWQSDSRLNETWMIGLFFLTILSLNLFGGCRKFRNEIKLHFESIY